jgi:hypothetical protein
MAREATMSNPITEVRALSPGRPLAPSEARVLAEKQAHRLLIAEAVDGPATPEQLIESLPRVEVRYVRATQFAATARWTGQLWRLLVNANDSWGRQRFSLAHELKHVLDHPDREVLYANPRFGSPYLQAERAADYFAACLLMPKAWVKRSFYGQRIRDPRVLARQFQVSTAAMRIRIDQLGLFELEGVTS